MNIYAESGTKVKFIGLDVHESDNKEAYELLKKGEVYTVESIEVRSWISFVTLREFPFANFNTVMFEEV